MNAASCVISYAAKVRISCKCHAWAAILVSPTHTGINWHQPPNYSCLQPRQGHDGLLYSQGATIHPCHRMQQDDANVAVLLSCDIGLVVEEPILDTQWELELVDSVALHIIGSRPHVLMPICYLRIQEYGCRPDLI
jgi:hypothetical protein